MSVRAGARFLTMTAACAAWLVACRWGAFEPTAETSDASSDGAARADAGDAMAHVPPQKLLSGPAYDLATFGGQLYWLQNDGVYACAPAAGQCTPRRVVEQVMCLYDRVSPGPTGVAWVNACPLEAGGPQLSLGFCSNGSGCPPAADLGGVPPRGLFAYLAWQGDSLFASFNSGEIETCVPPGCAWTTLTQGVIANPQADPWTGAVAADSNAFYFAVVPQILLDGGPAPAIYACPRAGCAQSDWKSVWTAGAERPGTADVPSLIIAGGRLHWASGDSVLSVACGAAGCSGQVDAVTGQHGAIGLAADGDFVYWANYEEGRVMKCAIGGCGNTPTELASGQATPSAVAVDATNVYWLNYASGEIWTASK
jgi:hypothetical protein